MNNLAWMVNGITDAEIRAFMPEGLRTPAAAYCRLQAYDPITLNTPNDLIQWCIQKRSDARYDARVGHRRAAWIVCVACVVHMIDQKRRTDPNCTLRDLTPKMAAMIDPQGPFPLAFCEEFLGYLRSPTTHQIQWAKDNPTRNLPVPAAIHNSQETVAWCQVPWPQ